MNWLKRFVAFWYGFVVGEDWRLAVGLVVALGIVGALVRTDHRSVRWLLPPVIVGTLILSLRKAIRQAR